MGGGLTRRRPEPHCRAGIGASDDHAVERPDADPSVLSGAAERTRPPPKIVKQRQPKGGGPKPRKKPEELLPQQRLLLGRGCSEPADLSGDGQACASQDRWDSSQLSP